MGTRTAKKAAAAKRNAYRGPGKQTAKQTPPAKPATDRGAIVDLHTPLPTRRTTTVGPLGAEEQAAARAALASAMLHLPIPVLAWHGPTAHLKDGTRITHTDTRPPVHNTPTDPPHFTAHVPCPHGAHHQHDVRSAADLAEARAITRTCTHPHTQPTEHNGHLYDWDNAIRHRLAPAPKPTAIHPLPEGIHRRDASTADTQPIPQADITAGLQTRAADTSEQPKENRQP